MLQREELENKTVDELRKMCRDAGISFYEKGKRLAKGPMIDKMLGSMDGDIKDDKENIKNDDKKNDSNVKQIEQQVDEKEIQLTKEQIDRKLRYVEQAKVGTIIAFRTDNDKVISAAIKKKSTKNRKFLVETKYGVEYKILFEDVLWVKTNKRWPKGIYLLFKKNIKNIEEVDDGKEIG